MTDLRLGRWQDVLADDPADGSVRLILTSPPYDNARTYEGTNEPVDFGELAAWSIRKLMPGGTMAMVLDGAVNDGVQSVTPYRVICEWAALEGWRLLQVLAYGRRGVPGEYKGRFRKDHEPLILMVKDGALHVCDKHRISQKSEGTLVRGSTFANRDGSKRGPSNASIVARETVHRGSVWIYDVGNGHDPSSASGHPATFAEAFARDAVDVWSNPGDLVVDPFAGSATVGRACEDLGRRFIGAERVPKYHAIGMQRLAQRGLFGVAS